MRGEYGTPSLLHLACERFTPTCVGNTSDKWAKCSRRAVHPHMRGEYATILTVRGLDSGSPPHAWGILQLNHRLAKRPRFTPTCVGNTNPALIFIDTIPVHPHMRGEYRLWEAHGLHVERFTPTCVGNTPRRLMPSACSPVHPHMRGEYTTKGRETCTLKALSPSIRPRARACGNAPRASSPRPRAAPESSPRNPPAPAKSLPTPESGTAAPSAPHGSTARPRRPVQLSRYSAVAARQRSGATDSSPKPKALAGPMPSTTASSKRAESATSSTPS